MIKYLLLNSRGEIIINNFLLVLRKNVWKLKREMILNIFFTIFDKNNLKIDECE